MTAKIVPIRPSDDPDVVLKEAIGELQHVLILGYDADGNTYQAASGYFADGGNILWAVETLKARLLNGDFM